MCECCGVTFHMHHITSVKKFAKPYMHSHARMHPYINARENQPRKHKKRESCTQTHLCTHSHQFKTLRDPKKKKEWLAKTMPPRLRRGDAKKIAEAEARFWTTFGRWMKKRNSKESSHTSIFFLRARR